MLLDCWSIPMVMFLTWIFLSTKYRYRKIAGVLVCVAGLVVVVFSDVHSGDRSGKTSISFVNIRVTKKVTAKLSPSVKTLQILIWIICTKSCLIEPFFFLVFVGGSNPRKGDILVIAGATLYAVSNVSEVSSNSHGYDLLLT